MDFSLSEEQIMLRDSVEKYVNENCGVERHRQLTDTALGFDSATWEQFAQLGWLAVPFAESVGGFDGGAVETMVVAQALGSAVVREPFLHTVITCGNFLQHCGNEEQQSSYIPAIISGSTQWAFAFAERGSDFELANVSTTAQSAGEAYTISGRKIAVLNGHCADYLIVSAMTDAGVTLFIVDVNSEGVQREIFVAVDGSKGAQITFENVSVAAAQVLGAPGEGVALMQAVIDRVIVAIGAEALGAMQALLNATVEYTKTREQFGQPISKFQVLQHRMADMFMKVEETHSLLLNAAIALDEGSDDSAAACAALKVKVAEAARFVSQEAVQLHGGMGMTDELIVGHHYKRLLLLSKLFGDERYYLDRYRALAA